MITDNLDVTKPSDRQLEIGRFTYWEFPDFNPLLIHPLLTLDQILADAHHANSEAYRVAHEGGCESAIFEYARYNASALHSPWVGEQIERWRRENTSQTRQKLRDLFTGFIGDGLIPTFKP